MRLAPRWLVVLLLLVGLVGCSVGRVSPPGPTVTPEVSLPPVPSVTTTAALDARPVLPMNDYRPAGFTDPPAGQGLERYAQQGLDWQPCGAVLCADVRVPLDYDRPDRTAITLALAKAPATAPTRLGSLFLNPGGPGGSGVDLVQAFRPVGLGGYDLIGWDPRGVGRSTPVQCYPATDLERYDAIDVSPDDPGERQTLLEEERAFGAACLARSGELLTHISTAETVRDLDLLRRLVGSPKLDYLGFSYGTTIGALYADRYPDQVGRMVLDGATDLTGESVPQVLGFERALTSFATWCVSQSCALGDSSAAVLATVEGVLQGLDQRPITVGNRQLSQQQGVQAVAQALYGGVSSWSSLAGQLTQAAAGDGTALLAQADLANGRSRDGRYDQFSSAFPAIRCLDSQATSVAAAEREALADNRAAPLLGPLSGPDLICTQWPVPPAKKRPTVTAAGAATILVIGTTGDPATPYEWAQAMATQLDSAVLLTHVGEGHTGYGSSACIRDRVRDLLVDGQLPPVGTRCNP